MDIGIVHSVWTVFVFVFFIAIVLWAYDGRRKAAFDAAARAPLDDDEEFPHKSSEETHHG